MKVPKEVKKGWDVLRQRGDIDEICRQSRFGRSTIGDALNGGDCTMDVFTAIQKFYNERKDKLNGLIHQPVNA